MRDRLFFMLGEGQVGNQVLSVWIRIFGSDHEQHFLLASRLHKTAHMNERKIRPDDDFVSIVCLGMANNLAANQENQHEQPAPAQF